MAHPFEDKCQQRPQRNEEQEQKRPGAWPFARRGCQNGDRGEVLHDQDADRDPSRQRSRRPFLFQHLHDEYRAGKTQRERDQQCLGKAETGDEGDSRECHETDCGGEAQHNDRHVQPGDGPNLRARQRSEVELEADREQQQGDAEVRQFSQHFPACDSIEVERETRGEKPYHGRQPDRSGHQTEDEGQGDPANVSQGDGDQLEVHGASRGGGSGVAGTL